MTTTVTKIVDVDNGVGADYTSLSAFSAALPASLVTADQKWVATCRCTGGSADTTNVAFTQTCDATRCIKIWTDPAESYHHLGVWSTAKYRLDGTGSYNLNITSSYVELAGLQIRQSTSSNYQNCITVNIYYTSVGCLIRECILISNNTNDHANAYAIQQGSYGAGFTARNNICYKTGTGTPDNSIGILVNHDTGTAVNLYNNTVVSFATNFKIDNSSTAVLKNNISQSSGTAGYTIGTGCTTTGSITNLSDRADAVGTSPQNSKTVTFKAAGDYHLASTDTVAIGYGTNLSSTFTNDIDNEIRPSGTAAWCIGADQYVATTPSGGIAAIISSSALTNGVVKGYGTLRAIASGVGTRLATLKGIGKLSGSSSGLGSLLVTAKGYGRLQAATAGAASTAFTIRGFGKLSSTSTTAASIYAHLVSAGGPAFLASQFTSSALAQGTLKGNGRLAGTFYGQASLSGHVSAWSPGSALAHLVATASATGTLRGLGKLTSTIAGTAFCLLNVPSVTTRNRILIGDIGNLGFSNQSNKTRIRIR
jgi:hypothetical protein